jgi:muramoyltetrapeptide carboxypeptidase
VYFATLADDAPPLPLVAQDARAVLAGAAEGPLLGGNLTMLCHLATAGRLPKLAGAILLLEDIHEAPYRIDRMLTSLRLGGHLDGVAGIAGGEFGPTVDPTLLDAIFVDRLGDLVAPIVTGLPIGHGERNRLTPLGVRVRLTAEPPSVVFLEGGVR